MREKKSTVQEMKNSNRSNDFDAWKSNDAWGSDTPEAATDWPTDNWATTATSELSDTTPIPGIIKYRALYEFVARNNDEISFQPGDIINVPTEQTGEPGWLAGEIRGHTGWFPESYVEPIDGVGVRDTEVNKTITPSYSEDSEGTRLEGIAEVPEVTDINAIVATKINQTIESSITAASQEQGDLTFNAGEVIAVYKKEGDWWTGKIGDNVGIFPSNYVQKVDVNSWALTLQLLLNLFRVVYPPEAINQSKPKEVELDAAIQASAQSNFSLARGQLIMIRKKTDSGWWEGELQAKGRKRQVGWFPASYVKVLNSSGKISGRTTPVSTTRMQQEVVIDKVVALYPYTASNPDELTFSKDDIISVTAREEEAWWKGELNGVSGVFPSNYVTPLQQQLASAQDKKRKECINEFIQTEKAYVYDMSVVHEVFETPLRNSKLISSKEIDDIFVNWQDILQCNKNFMADLLNAYDSGSDTVGNIICQHLPRMTAYITFCGKQLDSATLLQKLTENSTAFREFVKKCQNNVATKGMPLSSFLIKPMQRITRYPLLITKIMENTPTDHPDFKYLEEALRMAEKFLSCVNENVRLKENQDRLDWLQQCVQNDLNLPILIQNLLVNRESTESIEHGTDSNRVLNVQDDKSTYRIALLVSTVHECSLWMKRIESAKESYIKMASLNQQSKRRTLLNAGKWLCVTVVEGREIKSILNPQTNVYSRKKGRAHNENIYCKVCLGSQEQQTDIAKESINNGNIPQNGVPLIPSLMWNHSMQFQLRNINQEVLMFVVLEQNPFSPDEFLGRAELKLKDILRESQNHNGPITKKLILHQVESGELVVKLDLHLFNNY
ncbi:hypothetical protein NQ318_002388 [Aromia moschata]|uniref:Uncharacterized protein n=1 Tax=Aromia moschata TaxID=1265417 RepID=A0AAV8YGT8_9CUCU|nr:hypothetical protein NQ318_002388 [Aromia moschata]